MTPQYPTPPKKCREVFNILMRVNRRQASDCKMARVHGCVSNNDLYELTRKSSASRRLRDLVEFDRDLVCREDWPGKGRPYRVYWLNPTYPKNIVGRDLDMPGVRNPPAVSPHDVRMVRAQSSGYAPVRPGRDGKLFEFLVPGVRA